jgi:hypothetical protein
MHKFEESNFDILSLCFVDALSYTANKNELSKAASIPQNIQRGSVRILSTLHSCFTGCNAQPIYCGERVCLQPRFCLSLSAY